jgi:diguanylate cyclase (GGDEF)-like protein
MELVEQAESLVAAKIKLDDFAYYDEKTGLPNQRLCLDRMEFSLSAARRNKKQVAVMTLALESGVLSNEILREVAHCLGNLCRSTDTVGRLDGGNFLFVLGDIEDQNDAGTVARKAIQSLDEFLHSVDGTLPITTKIGIALFPTDGTTPEYLIQSATDTLHRIQQSSKSDIKFANWSSDASTLQ